MEKKSSETSPFNWTQICFTAFMAVLPFVYSIKGVDPVLIPRQTFLSLLVLLFAGWFVWKLKSGMVIQSILPFLFVLLSLLYVGSTFQALNRIESYYIALKISVFVAYFLVVYVGIKEQFLNTKLVFRAIAISGIIATALAIRDMVLLQTNEVDIFKDQNMYRVNATFGHKNLLSAYLFICLPMIIMQALNQSKRVWKMLFSFCTIITFSVIIILQTRAVFLALLVCFMVAVVLIVKSKLLSATQRKIGIGLLLAFLFTAGAVGFLYRDKLTNITRTESFIERKHVWENTWEMIAEQPIVGVGAANWQIHFPKYGMRKFYEVNYTITEGLTNFQRPHNDFLWVWAETGTLGFVVYVLIFLLSCIYAYQFYNKEQTTKGQMVQALIMLQLLGFMVISLVDFPLERIEHPVVIFTSIAILAASTPSAKIRMVVPKWMLLLFVLPATYALFVCSKRWQSEQVLRKMYAAHTAKNWSKLIEYGNKAQTPYFNMDYFSIPLKWYVGVGYFMQGNLATAKQQFEEAYRLHPYQIHVLNNYGACYEKEGDHVQAIQYLEEACRISPTFSDGIINLSGAYFNAGRFEEAYATIVTIGYDENNPRLKTFALAIIRNKLERLSSQTPNKVYATFLTDLITNDKALIAHYKFAKENHLVFLDYLLHESEN
jgi:O-antigen ligase